MSFSIEDFSLDFFSLHNKVAIVTGAAGELGRGLCSALAKAGANLLLVDIKEPDNRYLKHLTHEGVEVEFMTIDITKPDASCTIINRCLERFGQLDILVNNAGVCNINRPIDFNRNDWDPMINLNLNAAFDMSQAALNIFVPQRKGKIINMCSVLSFHGGRWSPGYA
ncbi:TPA: SDR family NAD(P)-dependent oxidoreductase, partial [Escherichia coli]